MVSTCVDPILDDVEFLRSNFDLSSRHLNYVKILQQNFQFLRRYLLFRTNWETRDVYLECEDERNVNSHDLVRITEDTVEKYTVGIRFLCLGRLRILPDVLSHFIESIGPLKRKIIQTCGCTALFDYDLVPSMRDNELLELVDSLIQILVDLRGRLSTHYIFHDDHVKLEALEDKLIFLKNLIRFSTLRDVELCQLEVLWTRIHVLSLDVARLYCKCDAIENKDEICLLISKQIPKIELVDDHLFPTCITILRASTSSANLRSVVRDKYIMWDFNDSLISRLWEIIQCSFVFADDAKGQVKILGTGPKSIVFADDAKGQVKILGTGPKSFVFADAAKDQVTILYMGLKFFRKFLREPQEKIDELNEKIGALLSEAGIIICSLALAQKKKGKVKSLWVKYVPNCYAMLFTTNRGINLIKDQISSSSRIGGLPSYHSFKVHTVRNTSRLVLSKPKITATQEVVVGFDNEVKTIVDRLLGGSRQLEVFPIVGMPGLGKTTLAKKVNQNPSVMSHFHIRLWCCVSQVYDKKKLTLQLLCDDDKYCKMNEDDLLQSLYKTLKGKRYLVVLDDVWDIGFWSELRLSFPNDENGSRMLLTSRFSNVASQVEFGKEPHNLRSLTECESWELLQKKVFGNEDCPQELHILGKKIAKNCKGLPLTIIIMAGVLATMEHDGWREVAQTLTSTLVYDTDLCKNTLQMSYEHLPHYLKPCFLYFGAFPGDREIEIEKLIWLWIAEGFVQNTEPKRLEDVAEDYLMDLIGRNLVMVSKEKSMGGAKTCRIHDLLHEFCKSKAREEYFLLTLQRHDELSVFVEPPNLQRLSICSEPEQFKKSRIFCSNLSTLLLFNPVVWYAELWMADILFVCSIYKHLRVLDFMAFCLICKDFPVEINVLVQLRYLAIRGTMRVIPPAIANLSNLETFLVQSHVTGSVSLPKTIWNMKKLRHLHIVWHDGCCLPNNTLDNASCLHNLDTFSRLNASSGKTLEEIVKKIPKVRQLQIKLSQSMQSNSDTLSLDSLNQLESLESLEVWSESQLWNDIEYCFPSTLKELILGYLHLRWSKISLVQDLPNLEVLKLLSKSFEGKRWDMKGGGFPKLRVLHLEDLDVVEWTDTDCDGNCFPSLEKLRLVKLSKLEKVPSCLGTIPTFKMIEVENLRGHESVTSLVQRIEEEQQNYGNENLKVLIKHR